MLPDTGVGALISSAPLPCAEMTEPLADRGGPAAEALGQLGAPSTTIEGGAAGRVGLDVNPSSGARTVTSPDTELDRDPRRPRGQVSEGDVAADRVDLDVRQAWLRWRGHRAGDRVDAGAAAEAFAVDGRR